MSDINYIIYIEKRCKQMQIYERIFTKGTKIQCKFFDTSFHPVYIGAEYSVGYELITALTYNREYISGLLSKLIRSYIGYLENPTEINRHSYEKDIYMIDEYCIYFHELSIVLLALIKDAYPDYSKKIGRVLTEYFSHNVLKEILNELDIMQGMKSVSDTIYLPFWDKIMHYLLDWYESYIANIKNDLLTMITSESNRVGLDRLCVLSDDRIKFYEEKEWKTRFSDGLKIPDKSKLIFSNCENNETANVWKSIMICRTNDLMYYDLILSLEYNLPIKMCKNCNVPFIPSGRPDTLYCDRIMPGFKCKCSAIGSINTYRKNLPKIEEEFYSTRKRYYTRTMRNPSLQSSFDAWKTMAKEKINEYRNGIISEDEFRKWFLDDEWTKK